MTERPILFSAPMVRAILDGKKTQTRRLVKPQPQMVTDMRTQPWDGSADVLLSLLAKAGKTCPYGQPGDQLWVRETWSSDFANYYPHDKVWYFADDDRKHDITVAHGTRGIYSPEANTFVPFRWRPSIHMPRWASRISLEITSVRVERLHDISDDDLEREGLQETIDAGVNHDGTPRDAWRALWTEINGHESWGGNPWVWVVEFTRTK